MKQNSNYMVKIATNDTMLRHALAVRSICYMHEIGAPAHQLFDENDYCGTHLVVYEDEEPVGSLRIRWFGDFAKFERTSFLPGHRNPYVIKRMAEYAFSLCARKGFRRVVTHSRPEFARLWIKLLGFERVKKPSLTFRDGAVEIVELKKAIDESDDVIGLDSDIGTLFRTEGDWDSPSQFEDRGV